ncbi:MAG: thiamine phosphate synthase [Actinobacteria bacterium]|nr:thiamine phosphate synthase [Actinomycetota bacterium]
MTGSLPPLLVLTDRALCAPRPLVDVITAAVEGGARALVLREKDLPRAPRAVLADQLRPILHDVGGLFLVASDPAIESDGVHLAAADPFPDPRPSIVGRSCHSLEDVQAAEAEGCDYVTLSPVFASISKPGHKPTNGDSAGVAGLPSITRATNIPIYALGGVDEQNASDAIRAGAGGLAVIGSVMGSGDPRASAKALADRSSWTHFEGARP